MEPALECAEAMQDYIRSRGRSSRAFPGASWILTRTTAVVLVALAVLAAASGASPRPADRAPVDPGFLAAQSSPPSKAAAPTVAEDGHGLGRMPNPVDLSHMTGLAPASFGDATPRALAASYDLRSLGRLTAVRDQGSCGSCWSFASLASLESWLLTDPAETWNLSENNLKECHGFDWGPCDGGNSSMAVAYLARRSGPILEADDPYRTSSTGCTSGLPVRKTLREAIYFPNRGGSLDNDVLKQAVMAYGAVSTDIYWTTAAYKSATDSYYYAGSAQANHAVDLVGWNDSYAASNFAATPPGNGAWIVRNSWGSVWGDGGYFYVSYYDTRIGQGSVAFVDAVNPDGATLYQYDPLGWITSWGYNATTGWGANVFTATSGGELRSVGTYASDVDCAYRIEIRGSLTGAALASQTGTWPFAGYHTVDLATPVPLAAGQTFVVVVSYTTSGYSYPIPAECRISGYSSGAAAAAGQSYISSDGSSWTDITTAWWGDPTCNVCIKAIVAPTSAPSAPAAASDFDASDGADAQSTLTWTNPGDSDLARVVVQRKTGSYPTSHTDGTNVYDNTSPTPGAAVSITNTGLTNGTTYYYAVFARDTDNLWNDTVTAGSNADTAAPAAIPSGGPVGYWRFNEGSGATTADASGNGGTATIVGAAWVAGSPDASVALSFNGSGQYVQVPANASLDFPGAFTLEAWINPAVLSGYHAILVRRGTNSQATYGLWTSGDKLYAEVRNYNRSSATTLLGNTPLTVGAWYHVALQRSVSGEVSLWVGGVRQTATSVVSGAVNPPEPLYIGRHSTSPTQDWRGTIDEVRLHGRALDPSEFNVLPSLPVPPALVSNFVAADGQDAQSALTWTNPGDSDLARVVVQRKTGSYPTSHTDGTNVYDNTSPTPGAAVSIPDTGLTNGTTYYYAVFSKDSDNLWNDAVSAGSNADTATPSATPTAGPVGYWKFDEGSGTTALDSSGSGNQGTITSATYVTGQSGTALSFDGLNDSVRVLDNASLCPTAGVAIDLWVRLTVISDDWIVDKSSDDGLNGYLLRTDTPSNTLQFYVGNSKAKAYVSASVTTGVWYHVLAKYDGALLSLYLNDVLKASAPFTGGISYTNTGNLYFGSRNGSSLYLAGRLDEVQISGDAAAPQNGPPTLVANFTASDGADAQSTLTWTNPGDSDLARVVVQRKTGSYPTSHTDGTNVYDSISPTPGAAVSITNTGLTNGTTYYYAVFAKDTDNLWNDTVTAGSNADTASPGVAPTAGPVGYWRFNEGSGTTTADASGSGLTGTIAGAAWVTGSPDATGALSFSGLGQYVQIPASVSLEFSSAFTLEAWINPTAVTGYHAILVRRGTTSQATYGLWTSGDKLYAEVKNFNRSSSASLLGNTSLSAGTWYHVALRRSVAGEVSLWVNGAQQAATSVVTGALNPPEPLYIGRHSANPAQDWTGVIDEVRIHGRALDASEFNLLPLSSSRSSAIPPLPERPTAFVRPNPVRSTAAFGVNGLPVEALEVRIFSFSGELVFSSGWQAGPEVQWRREDDQGNALAAGPYLYVLSAQLDDGQVLVCPVGKVFVRER